MGLVMRTDLEQFLKEKAASRYAEGYNWIVSLHPNTWYFCVNNTKEEPNAIRHYRLAGLCEGEVGQWFKLENLKCVN